jgi:hypothetical protein
MWWAARKTSFVSVMQKLLRKNLLRKCGAWLCVLPVLASSLSWAADPPTSLDVKLWNGSSMYEWTPAIISTGSGYTINDVTYHPPGASLYCYNVSLDFDPFISASVDVVNNTALTQTYTLIFTLPIAPAITTGSLIGGSTQGGLTDANFNGIGTLSTVGPGTALYYGQIDGVDVLPLFSHLKTINVPFAGGSASDSTSAGLPGPTIPGPNALTSIGIKHQFSLTPGDRATFTSFFVVNPVPEPSSLSLLAIGVLMVLRRRKAK